MFFNFNKQFNKNFAVTLVASVIVSSVFGFAAGLLAFNYFPQFPPTVQKIISQGGTEAGEKIIVREENAVVEAVKMASPAVVSVVATKDVPVFEREFIDPFGDFFGGNDPFGDLFPQFQVPQLKQKGTEKKEVSGGTGFIISSDGLILTNKHVVSIADAEYTVVTNDGEKIPAAVLDRDPAQDIAVLKIDRKNLPIIKLGNSDDIIMGQTVIAIGNALGEFRNTISVGVISGLSRSITASGGGIAEELEHVIQTDAAINRGNSGGPLLNLRGEAIGINTAVVLGAQNIGFALPINAAKKDIQDIEEKGKIVAPFLGVRYAIINPAIQKANNLPVDYGALVRRGENPEDLAVVPGSAADKAGIVENDIILEISGEKITEQNPLSKIIKKRRVGDKVKLKVLSKGEEKIVEAVLEER